MEKRDIKVFDCDVFCTEDFSLYDDIVITGNFYAEGNVLVASLEAGGDIIINAPEFVSADTILSLGAVSICAPVVDSVYIHAESGCSILACPREPYAILRVRLTHSNSPDEKCQLEIEDEEENDDTCPHCLLRGNCSVCPCALDICDDDCNSCKLKDSVCDCPNDCETCEYSDCFEDEFDLPDDYEFYDD